MKKILYIGNNLKNSKSNVSGIQILGPLLESEGHVVYYASSKANKLLRLLDMITSCLWYSKKVDVVLIDTYSTQNFYYAWVIGLICRRYKLPYMPILHGGDLPKRLQSHPSKSDTLFNNAICCIAPSLYIKEAFEQKGYRPIVYIPNAIEMVNYPISKKTFEIPKLLWVRSFSKIYNPTLAISVLKSLQDRFPEAELCMVGPDSDGSLKAVIDLANELHVAVKITGKLTKTEWIHLSKDYNIFINTTNFDNMPVSVIEAMALGLPVVSTNVGGMPYLITNQREGILVNPDNVLDMVNAIQGVMSDRLKREEIIRNARLKAEQLDWKHIKKQWIDILEQENDEF
ncbi:glycosyltransferase family 4 protein [Psychroserpens burtonensis]|uniref:glycosyltransferase family 4 protein n=1 Tax=Psychroserpens burtonensis TaxID=49278 RepID=UPI0004195F27|nr:glycosyltransferase family 4 protein [Psychroserpens burtonensis]